MRYLLGHVSAHDRALVGKPLPLIGLVAAVAVAAADAGPPYYPEDYRQWTVAKFRFIGPESRNGKQRAVCAITTPMTRRSPAGASFATARSSSTSECTRSSMTQNVWQEDGIAHVAVMRKDADAHADTGGWYFNFFTAQRHAIGITPQQAKARCFEACHQAQEARDFVFSDPRR